MPLADGIQHVPAPPDIERIECGAVQFGNDWPGLFLRGDTAHTVMMRIRKLAELLADHPDFDVRDNVHNLQWIADLIERDVIV